MKSGIRITQSLGVCFIIYRTGIVKKFIRTVVYVKVYLMCKAIVINSNARISQVGHINWYIQVWDIREWEFAEFLRSATDKGIQIQFVLVTQDIMKQNLATIYLLLIKILVCRRFKMLVIFFISTFLLLPTLTYWWLQA